MAETEEQMMERAKALLAQNPFCVLVGMELCWIEEGRASMRVEVKEELKNLYRTVHGGVSFSLADTCSGVVARSDGRFYVTQHADISYLYAPSKGRLTAESRLIKRGRQTCLVSVEVRDDSGRLVVYGTYTFFCTDAYPRLQDGGDGKN